LLIFISSLFPFLSFLFSVIPFLFFLLTSSSDKSKTAVIPVHSMEFTGKTPLLFPVFSDIMIKDERLFNKNPVMHQNKRGLL
jgi:hypothetical protein